MAFFGRFTERAQRALVYAQEEAKNLGHNYVGTEHLLLGLLQENEGVAARVLKGQGIDAAIVRDQIEALIGKGDYALDEGFGYTPRTKRILELSFYEARSLGHNYVGTEHLLLALVREGEGVGARILKDAGVDLENLRAQIIDAFKEESMKAGEQKGTKRSNTPT